MREILEFSQQNDLPWWHGAVWALGLGVCELARAIAFAASWGVATRYYSDSLGWSYLLKFMIKRTAIRLRSAVMTAVYKKIMQLPNLGDKSIGEVLTYNEINL